MKTFWDMSSLASSYWGMYAVQTVLHALIASMLVDCALLCWGMRTPEVKQRFRFLVIFLPAVAFPLYQLIDPGRGNVYFRLESLLDSNKLFFLEVGGLPVFLLIVVILAISSLIFFVQELVPIILQMTEQMRGPVAPVAEEVDEAVELKVSKALEDLPFDEEAVEVLNDEDLMIFSSTGLHPRIYLSAGIIKAFSPEQLQAALAHEIGHIQRSRKQFLIVAYVLRVFMFYNPVAMFEFRKLAQEEEEVCDDFAVALTGKPEALSEAVDILRPTAEDYDVGAGRGRVRNVASAIEYHSHNALMKSRMLRIAQPGQDDSPWKVPYAVTLALIVGINYFVV